MENDIRNDGLIRGTYNAGKSGVESGARTGCEAGVALAAGYAIIKLSGIALDFIVTKIESWKTRDALRDKIVDEVFEEILKNGLDVKIQKKLPK